MVSTYFTRIVSKDGKKVALANNGWVWNADPLVNFASSQSESYFLREIIVWGDCVKLRYGDKLEDNPWLWEHMKKYTLKMATIFEGLRIDNCHSTPMHVAQYFLDNARKINPNLFVYAELFTGSEEVDLLFTSRLGLNALIRESMHSWDSKELSRLAYMYGGASLGSFGTITNIFDYSNIEIKLNASSAPPLFMDCTHDNETPSQKRTPEDSLSNAFVVGSCRSSIGSVYGYDEIIPKVLNIVHENRLYQEPDEKRGIILGNFILKC